MFTYNGRNTAVKRSVRIANDVHEVGAIYEAIITKDRFDMASIGGIYISNKLSDFIKNNNIKIKLYRSRNPWSKAYGYFTPSRPLDINLNTRKLGRSDASLVGTFYHEAVHMTDNADRLESYGHGNNSPAGKSNTAPYWIGNKAKSYFSATRRPAEDHENSTNGLNFWGRVRRLFRRIF